MRDPSHVKLVVKGSDVKITLEITGISTPRRNHTSVVLVELGSVLVELLQFTRSLTVKPIVTSVPFVVYHLHRKPLTKHI